jgi:dipeptidyl aminopeptidase/acylaminoacyl peptidase
MPRTARLAPQDLSLLRLPSDARLSPDGRLVVFVESRVDLEHDSYRRGLRLVDAAGGRVEAWTDGAYADESPAWLPDSRQVVFVSDRNGESGLWRLRVGAHAPQLLLQLPGRLRAPRPSPDGRRIAFLYAPPGATHERRRGAAPGAAAARFRHVVRLDFKHDGRGFRDGAFLHLWVLDLGRRRARQITFGDWDDCAFDWSPDGRRLVFESNRIARADVRKQNSDLHVVPARGGRPRVLTRFRGPKHSPAWSPDGRWIAFVGHAQFPDTVDTAHVWVVPAVGGKARDLMAGADLDCNDTLLTDLEDVGETPPAPVWSARGDRLFGVASREGTTNIWEVPLRGGAPRPRSLGRHGLRGLSQSRDGRRWAFVRRDAVEPGDVWVATAAGAGPAANGAQAAPDTRPERAVPGARMRRLTGNAAALHRARRIVAPQPIRIPSPAGHVLHGWILRAPTAPRRGPIVLMIHGGPHAMYGWSFMHEFQVLAQHGYHVAFVNLRGSTGYGRDFMRALVGTWGSRDFEDLMRVADVLEKLPFVDRRRIAVAGGSYGGYLTAWAIAHTRRFAAAVAMRGVYDLPSMFGTSDIGPELLTEFEGQAPWDSIDRWWRVSPVAHAANIRTPLLLLHGEDDHRCPISQAEELFTALRLLDRDVELVRFLGDGHDMSRSGRPHNRVARLRLLLDWLGRKL